jgi:hypothetical protein
MYPSTPKHCVHDALKFDGNEFRQHPIFGEDMSQGGVEFGLSNFARLLAFGLAALEVPFGVLPDTVVAQPRLDS